MRKLGLSNLSALLPGKISLRTSLPLLLLFPGGDIFLKGTSFPVRARVGEPVSLEGLEMPFPDFESKYFP